jgi:hypothetical protein
MSLQAAIGGESRACETPFSPGEWPHWRAEAGISEALAAGASAFDERGPRSSRWLATAAAMTARATLVRAARSADTVRLADGAARLAGLGEGLTPAGDDYLVGALHALWLVFPRASAESISRGIAEAAVARTTRVGGFWIEAAARGEVAPWWRDFFAQRTPENRRQAVQRIAATGHTSGLSSLAGFLETLRALTGAEEAA